MIVSVRLDETGTKVISVFGGPQDPDVYTNLAELEDDDQRYLDFMSPPPDYLALALSERDQRLAEATIRIAPLQDAVDLEEATTEEVAMLKKWKKYRVELSRIEQQPGFPADVAWPVIPA